MNWSSHRHSASPNVEVKFQRFPDLATLEIQDFGKGLPKAVMDRFERTGAGSGVGLAGIRERVKELGGDFTISSSDAGTILRSVIPLSHEVTKSEVGQAPSPKDVLVSGTQAVSLATNANRA